MANQMNSSTLRILMLLENNPYRRDVRVRNEAESLVRAGYGVSVICPASDRKVGYQNVDGVHIYAYPEPATGNGKAAFVLEYGYSVVMMFFISLYVLFRRGFNVVHAHNPPDLLVFIGLFYKALGKRFVFDHHDLSPELYRYAKYEHESSGMVYRVLVFLENLSCRIADRVIATNQSYKEIEVSRAGIAPEKIYIVRNGPKLKQEAAQRALSGSASLKLTIGYLGIIGLQDGVQQLNQAIYHLVNDFGRRDFCCVIAGKGDALADMQALTHKLGLDEFITYPGWVEFEKVPAYLQSFDICVASEPSSPYGDRSTAIKMMEYMSFAKPVVAFDLPEHHYSAGDAALYAADNDAIEMARLITALMDDPQLRHKMGSFGYKRVKSVLAWEHQERELLRLYQSLLEPVAQPVIHNA